MSEKSDLGLNESPIATCTSCNAPLVDGSLMTDIKRIWTPYHACVSWTYVTGERADEALLRIRKEMKVAAGWWNDSEEQQWQEAMTKLGVEF